MKKLLLLLLCVPLIGLGQWSGLENRENIRLLLELDICTTDSIENPNLLPICYHDYYFLNKINETYLIVYMEDDKSSYWCGSVGCSIHIYKKEKKIYVLKASFGGWIEDYHAQDIIIYEKDYYTNDDEEEEYEYVTRKLSLVNNMILVEPEFYEEDKGIIQSSKPYFIR